MGNFMLEYLSPKKTVFYINISIWEEISGSIELSILYKNAIFSV